MIKGIVYDIMRYALNDGPGIRTIVFLKGCPLSCQWCSNPESQSFYPEFIFYKDQCMSCNTCETVCAENAVSINKSDHRQVDLEKCTHCNQCVDRCFAEALRLVGRSMSVEAVMTDVMKDCNFYMESGGGVTFSGGEPFSQPEFLKACLKACKTRNLNTAVETAGIIRWELIESLLPLVDLFLFDLKAGTAKDYKRFTGIAGHKIFSNLEKLLARHDVIIRIPMIPGLNDRGQSWKDIIDFLEQLNWRGRIDLLPYHRMGIGKYIGLNREYGLDSSKTADMENIKLKRKQLAAAGFKTCIHGG
ncbi:MAG: hypothetical protein A2277_11180 [Desulfobacterales bacterium RIFOXYA12_FULL_46_15]|nr:MAG: hypothetical protein A2277_11180 [Desulfobacterales bacterium RIFOXYA12_FULL_46_15]